MLRITTTAMPGMAVVTLTAACRKTLGTAVARRTLAGLARETIAASRTPSRNPRTSSGCASPSIWETRGPGRWTCTTTATTTAKSRLAATLLDMRTSTSTPMKRKTSSFASMATMTNGSASRRYVGAEH